MRRGPLVAQRRRFDFLRPRRLHLARLYSRARWQKACPRPRGHFEVGSAGKNCRRAAHFGAGGDFATKTAKSYRKQGTWCSGITPAQHADDPGWIPGAPLCACWAKLGFCPKHSQKTRCRLAFCNFPPLEERRGNLPRPFSGRAGPGATRRRARSCVMRRRGPHPPCVWPAPTSRWRSCTISSRKAPKFTESQSASLKHPFGSTPAGYGRGGSIARSRAARSKARHPLGGPPDRPPRGVWARPL